MVKILISNKFWKNLPFLTKSRISKLNFGLIWRQRCERIELSSVTVEFKLRVSRWSSSLSSKFRIQVYFIDISQKLDS